ncbi:MAG: sugar transferase [Chloroflexi bacterium]|nr:sugar transferase [Chloroflexota bacterium]
MPGSTVMAETQLIWKIQQASKNLPRYWQWRLYTFSLIANDLIMTGLAFRLAYFLRFEASLGIFQEFARQSFSFYQSLVLILIPTWLFIFAATGLYQRKNLLGGTAEYAAVFNATTLGMFSVIAVGFLLPDFIFARGWLLMAWILAFLFTAAGRFTLRRVIYALRAQGYYMSPAVIVGANDEGISLANQLKSWQSSGIHLLGFLDKKIPAGRLVFGALPCLGPAEKLDEIVKNYGVEEIILATSAISSRDKMLDIFKRYGVASGVNVRMSSGLYEIITTGLTVKDIAYVPLVEVNPVRMTGVDSALKLMLDYTLTITGLLAILPMLLVIAIAIRLDSPGPIIHRRRVMGMNGKQFDAFKFRTMHINGDEILASRPDLQAELAQNHKLKDDPRITRIGKFLRKLSLDELPQLVNVLRGEMSLVGPRMITPAEIDKYNKWDMNLLTVRPGITGLWQVSGRSDISYEERVRLDMHYIRNWSIWLDLQLLTQTIPAVIKGHGAY